MKMAILSSKKRLKRPLGNIHFGKIILIMLLILGQVFTVNINKVEASGQLYYYDKYFHVEKVYSYGPGTEDFRNGILSITLYDYEGEGSYSEIPINAYVELLETGFVDGKNVYIYRVLDIDSYRNPSTYYHYVYTNKPYTLLKNQTLYNQSRQFWDTWIFMGDIYRFEFIEAGTQQYSISDRSKYLIQKDLILPSTYPNDGLHSDGLWYVRKGLANTIPTITTTSPVQNSYFSKVNQAQWL